MLKLLKDQQALLDDPILAIGNIGFWLDADENLNGVVNGDNLTTWTDKVNGHAFSIYNTAPKLELAASVRAVQFADVGGFNIADHADFSPAPLSGYSIVVMLGSSQGTNGTLVGKCENGSSPMHYQLQSGDIQTNGILGSNFNVDSTATPPGQFVNFSEDGTGTAAVPWSAYDILTLTTGSDGFSTKGYRNNTELIDYGHSSGNALLDWIGNYEGVEDLYIGCRGNGVGGVGYSYDGTIRHVLFFNKELSPAEIATIVSNLV